ncbi:MAG: FHA domain-containing protein, partial [Planctomycetota bacterium]
MYKIIQHSPYSKTYPNLSTPITIGRSRRNHIFLKGKNISRKHCQIFETKGTLFLQDLKSVNGTYLQGHSVGLKKIELGTPFSVGPLILTLLLQETTEPSFPEMSLLPHWLLRKNTSPALHWLATSVPLKKISARLKLPKRPKAPKIPSIGSRSTKKNPSLSPSSFFSKFRPLGIGIGIGLGLTLLLTFIYWHFLGYAPKTNLKENAPDLFSLRRLPPSKRPYFEPQIQQAIQEGIHYLLRHQSANGSWEPHHFNQECQQNPCTELGEEYNTIGMTGLTILVLLAEEGLAQSQYQSACQNALQFLVASQQEDGLFGPPRGKYTYNHAIATLALAEAMILSPQPRWSLPLKKALTKIVSLQNRDGGWRYGLSSQETSDLSVTGWMIKALFMGRKAQVPISAAHFLKAQHFLQSRFHPESGSAFYLSPEELTSPNPPLESMTATYLICATLFQQKLPAKSLARLSRPKWEPKEVNYYYWLQGSEALHLTQSDEFRFWYQDLVLACLPHQEKQFCRRGSFPPVDFWSSVGGRLYSTLAVLLALQSSYRYHPEATW